jgi:hypothetical protein
MQDSKCPIVDNILVHVSVLVSVEILAITYSYSRSWFQPSDKFPSSADMHVSPTTFPHLHTHIIRSLSRYMVRFHYFQSHVDLLLFCLTALFANRYAKFLPDAVS